MSKSKRKDWCSAVKCKRSGAKYPELSFFRFPKDEERCAEWVRQCGRKDLQGKSAKYLYTNCRICSKHFEQKQILNTGRLVWNAVPTKFKHGHTKTLRGQRERAQQIHERSGPLGQRLKKKLAHLVSDAEKEEMVVRQEPLSKYLTFTEKDIEVRIKDQRQSTRSRNLQSAENVAERSKTYSSRLPPLSNPQISGKNTEMNETDLSQEPTSSDLQMSDDNTTVIEMDHSYINPDSELSEGNQETINAEGIQHQTLKGDQEKATNEMQAPHQGSSEHSNLQPTGQKSPRIVYIQSPQNESVIPIAGSQNEHFQLVHQDKNSEMACLELLNEACSCFLLSSEAPQQGVPLKVSCPSTSKVIQLLPTSHQNETSSHSIQKVTQVKSLPKVAKIVRLQLSSRTTPQNGRQSQPGNVQEMTPQNKCLAEPTDTNIENVHHEEIVVAAKRTRRSAKKSSSTLRVRLFRAKAKIKKLEAALEEVKKQKSRHKEKKKRALKDVSWASLTSNKRKPHGRRYSEKHKMFAIGLYKQSHKAYQFCRKELSLPSIRSLQEWMKKDKVKAKDILSESVRASIPMIDSIETDEGTAEEETPEIIIIPEQENTEEAVSCVPEQDRTEVLVETSEQGEVNGDPCMTQQNMTEVVICSTQQDRREEISLSQEEVVNVVEAFMCRLETT